MFSLVITLVAVALVAALALATVYYAGAVGSDAQAKAQATKLRSQGNQVLSAMDLFAVDHGRWPNSIEELVPEYLKTVPGYRVAQGDAPASLQVASYIGPTASASNTGSYVQWRIPTPGVPTAVVSVSVDESTCRRVNVQSFGQNGIPLKAYTSLATQCYGATADTLAVVVTKSSEALAAALPSAEVVDAPTPPSASQASAWLRVPSASSSGVSATPTPSAQPAKAQLISGSLEWGEVPVGALAQRKVVFRNIGEEPMTLTGLQGLPARLSESASTCTSVPANATCEVTLTLDTSAPASVAGSVTGTNGAAFQAFSSPVSATVLVISTPRVSVQSGDFLFGSVTLNENPDPRTVVFRNDGAPVTVTTLQGLGALAYVTVTSDCTGKTLNYGDTCSVTADPQPTFEYNLANNDSSVSLGTGPYSYQRLASARLTYKVAQLARIGGFIVGTQADFFGPSGYFPANPSFIPAYCLAKNTLKDYSSVSVRAPSVAELQQILTSPEALQFKTALPIYAGATSQRYLSNESTVFGSTTYWKNVSGTGVEGLSMGSDRALCIFSAL